MNYKLEWFTPCINSKMIITCTEKEIETIKKALVEGIGFNLTNESGDMVVFGGELVKQSIFILEQVHEDNS